MHPLAHLEEKLRTHRRKRFNYHLANFLGFFSLIATAIIIAPLLHEFLHMFFLDMNNMAYSAEINFNWASGVYGELTPFTELSIKDSIILLGVGILGNLVLSAIFFLGGWSIKNKGMIPESIYSTYLAVGFFYNPLIYFFASSGDLINILTLMNLQNFFCILPMTGCIMFLMVSLYIYEHAKNAFWEYYMVGEEIEKLEQFLGFRSTAGGPRIRTLCRQQQKVLY